MKLITKIIALFFVLIIVAGILLWISHGPSRNAKRIVPGTSFQSVQKLLGKPLNKKDKDGMNLYYFEPNFAAAGPIEVGFDNENKTVYLKIWEDVSPQFDLRKQN
jgi:hypothetical protein